MGFLFGLVAAGILADQIGWRWTFVAVGLPGILYAVALRLSVREPKRGRLDGENKEQVERQEPFATVIQRISSRGALIHLTVGITFSILAFNGAMMLLTQIFARVHN